MAVLDYPSTSPHKQAADSMLAFLRALGAVLPCATCKQHYNDYLAKLPPPVSEGKDALFAWLWAMQAAVSSKEDGSNDQQLLDVRQAKAFYGAVANGMSNKHMTLHITQLADTHAPS